MRILQQLKSTIKAPEWGWIFVEMIWVERGFHEFWFGKNAGENRLSRSRSADSFISGAASIERAPRRFEQVPMMRLHTKYPDLVCCLIEYKIGKMEDDVRIGELRWHVKEFKIVLKAALDEIWDWAPFA